MRTRRWKVCGMTRPIECKWPRTERGCPLVDDILLRLREGAEGLWEVRMGLSGREDDDSKYLHGKMGGVRIYQWEDKSCPGQAGFPPSFPRWWVEESLASSGKDEYKKSRCCSVCDYYFWFSFLLYLLNFIFKRVTNCLLSPLQEQIHHSNTSSLPHNYTSACQPFSQIQLYLISTHPSKQPLQQTPPHKTSQWPTKWHIAPSPSPFRPPPNMTTHHTINRENTPTQSLHQTHQSQPSRHHPATLRPQHHHTLVVPLAIMIVARQRVLVVQTE